MKRCHVSLEEAESILSEVRADIIRLRKINQGRSMLNSIEIEYDNNHETLMHNLELNKNFHRLTYEFYEIMERLYKKGCYIRSIDQGLVDFLSFYKGRDIFLCWNISENQIKGWHELETNCHSVKPLSMIRTKTKGEQGEKDED